MPLPPDDTGADGSPLNASVAGWSAAPAPAGSGERAGATWLDGEVGEPAAPASVGRYVVGPLLGQGGMGRVFAATDVRLDREVAFKEALPGTEARLAREARVTARLDHPNIVPVHDAGRSPDGRAFYAMRLVRGRSLAAALADAQGLPARLRHVRTLLAVADAVAFAHARGVVHRDLKPANVLVGEFGETQVMDWGVARVLGGGDPLPAGVPPSATAAPLEANSDSDALTGAGGVVGTPRYMSPEQARGEPADPRADVWSLGAMLYEILAEAPPYAGPAEQALAAARTGEVPPLRARAPDAPAELAAVAHRALSPDPADRYPTARAFAAELEAWLDGRRVEAHAYTPRELLARLVRAWRTPLAVGAVAAGLLAAGVTAASVRVVAERDRARQAEAETAKALAVAEDSLAGALVSRALTALEADDPVTAELAAARALTLRESADARGVLAAFAIGERPRLLSRAPAPACDEAWIGEDPAEIWCDDAAGAGLWDARTGAFRWRAEGGRAAVAAGRAYVTATDEAAPVPRVYELSTGRAVEGAYPAMAGFVIGATRDRAAVAGDGDGAVWRIEPGRPATPLGRCADGVRAPVARSDDRWLVYACTDGALTAFGKGAVRHLSGALPSPTALVILGDTVVLGSTGGRVAVVDLATGAARVVGDAGVGPVRAIEPWPSGGGVAVLGDRGLAWWDTDTGGLWLRMARSDVRTLAARGGSLWLLGDALEEWSTPALPPARVLASPAGVGGVTVDATGDRVLAFGGGGGVWSWSTADGRLLADLAVQEGATKAAAFGPDGGVIAAAASPPGLVWHAPGAVRGADGVTPPGFRNLRYKRALALRSGWTALFGYGNTADLVPWGAPAPAGTLALGAAVYDTAQAPGGAWGVALDAAGGVYRVEGAPPTARRLFTDPEPGAVAATDGRIVVASRDEVRVYDEAGARLATFPTSALRDVAISPDGRWVAAGTASGRTSVWDVDAGVRRAVLHGHSARVQGVAFSPDGRWLATGSWDGTTRRWGLDVLDAAPRELERALQAAWGRTLEDLEGM